QWKTVVDLSNPGELTRIHVKAWDHRGNLTDSVLLVSRDAIPGQLPPALSWKSPDKASGTVIPFAQSRYLVQVILTDISGIDSSSVRINDAVARPVNDSVWEQWMDLPPNGQAQTITVEAKNKRGVPTSGFRSVTRAKDQEAPTATRGERTKDRTVVFDTASVEVAWTARDNDKIAQAWIQDSLVVSDASGYHRRVPLVVGRQWIKFRAVDPAGNEFRDSVSVERLMDTVKPVQISDTNGKLRSGSFWVKLSCASAGATIRYTLDGSEPKVTSTIFADSIKIDTTITLKARAFAVGRVDGPVVTQGYQLAVPVSISGSETHYLVVLSDGSLWGFGSNNCNAIFPDQGCVYMKYPDGSSNGKLDGQSWDQTSHRMDSAVLSATAGTSQSFWIRTDHTLWAVGSNGGSMGIATGRALLSPELIFREVSRVELVPTSSEIGGTGAVAMQSNGKVWAAGGSTGAGKLTKNSSSWTKVADSAIEIRSSKDLLLVLKRDRSLWGIGSLDGQLTRMDAWTKIADSVATFPRGLSESILFQKLDGSVWQAGYYLPGTGLDPMPLSQVPALSGVKIEQIETSVYEYLLRTSTGDVIVYGKDVSFPRVIASGIREMAVGGQGLATISTSGELRVRSFNADWTLNTAPDRDLRIRF
ncbi:MAG TPA: chitobiase/beta-hexosaminidase C-terminal domain-containing protein, partial [Fibrobacteria bacterium]|nr:chitobiase/beta-hexosaminidase C-terminal domain-containing protein [Fibrobacteria bacterium]